MPVHTRRKTTRRNAPRRAAAVAALLLAASALPVLAKDPPPREAFFVDVPVSDLDVALSPDGRRIAFRGAVDGHAAVLVREVEGGPARVVADERDAAILSHAWAFDEEHLILERRDARGRRRVDAVHHASAALLTLSPPGRDVRLEALDPAFPHEVVLAAVEPPASPGRPETTTLLRVDLRTGESREIERWSGRFGRAFFDGRGHARARWRLAPDGGAAVDLRDTPGGEWYEFVRWTPREASVSRPLALSRDGRHLWLADARGRDTAALGRAAWDDEGRLRYEVLASHDRADVDAVSLDPVTGDSSVAWFEFDRATRALVDPDLENDLARLDDAGLGEPRILDRDLRDDRWLVAFHRPDQPDVLAWYDRSAGRVVELLPDAPARTRTRAGDVETVLVPTRDGRELLAVLTFPPSERKRVRGGRPTILLLHDEPRGRHRARFDPLSRFLASRGYVVLSVNRRGAAGLGADLAAAAKGEWARGLTNDLIDAVNWAVAERITDPDRVALLGRGFGGFVALSVMSRAPEFFAAGAVFGAPMDLRDLAAAASPVDAVARWRFEFDLNLASDPEALDRLSPLDRVDRIARPLLIAQGARDPAAPVATTEAFLARLRTGGVPTVYAVFERAHAVPDTPEDRAAWAALLEQFFAATLGGRREPIGDALRRSSAVLVTGREHLPEFRDRDVAAPRPRRTP